jgi:diacylglycerol kinase family enzyme
MRPVILANPRSTGENNPLMKRLLYEFARAQSANLIYLDDLSFETTKQPYEQIIIAGGDGTFQLALNNKHFRKKSIGYFPLGAGNAVFSSIYANRTKLALATNIEFKEKKIDVLELSWDKKKVETMFLSAGFDATVTEKTVRSSLLRGYDYLKAIAKTTQRRNKWKLSITVDNETFENTVSNITIGKIAHYGYGIRSLPQKIIPEDGRVYAIISLVQTKYPSLERAFRLFALNLTKMKGNNSFEGKKITVKSSRAIPLQAGGEFLGRTKEFTVQVKRQQSILVPLKKKNR